MIIGFCFICVFVLLKNICTADTVYSQVTVEGFIGESVLLPCASSKNKQNLQDINVLWKYNDSTNVLAIINGKDSVEHQKPKFKNRIQTLSDKYEKGIFNLTLDNLTHTDAGMYQCFITHSSELVTVLLRVNESAKAKPPGAKEETRTFIISVICFSLFIVLLGIVCIFAIVKKRGSKTSSSGESANGACLFCPVSFQQISNTPEPTSQNHQEYSELPANI